MSAEPTIEGGSTTGGTRLLWMQAPFLLALWLLFSGKFDLFHISMGVLAVAFVIWLDRRLEPANLGKVDLPIRVHPVRALMYGPWLLGQMLISSYQVARIILIPSEPLNPVLVRFTTTQPNTIARVMLGNSITLTPGTLTLDIEGNEYLVHALSDVSREGLVSGDMQRRVARVFSAEGENPVSNVEVVRNQPGGGAQI